MEDVENAILCAVGARIGSDELRLQAQGYLEGLKAAPNAWQHCCELFTKTKHSEVRFWCLMVLIEYTEYKYALLGADGGMQLRNFFLNWVAQELCKDASTSPPFILNKVAQLIAIIIRNDYPDIWVDPFQQLIQLLSCGLPAIDMFLRILICVDEDIISRGADRTPVEAAVATRVKDSMREQCIVAVVDALYNILVHTHEKSPQHLKMCLSTIARYIAWVDIGLFASDRFLLVYFGCLSQPNFVMESCDCILEIVAKKMDPASKLVLLNRIVHRDALQSALNQRDPALAGKVSTLLSGIGREVLLLWEKTGGESAEIMSLMSILVPLILHCFGHADTEISKTCVEFVGAYVNRLKRLQMISAEQQQHIGQLLLHLRRKAMYPPEFNHEKPEEEEAEFMEYRKALWVIFKNTARLCSNQVKAFVFATLSEAFGGADSGNLGILGDPAAAAGNSRNISSGNNNNSVSNNSSNSSSMINSGGAKGLLWGSPGGMETIELALTMVYELGEGLSEEVLRTEQDIVQLLQIVFVSNASYHPHFVVSFVHMELLFRYSKVLASQPPMLTAALERFFDERGLRHPHPSVRKAACSILVKLVKALKAQLIPHAGALLVALQPLLFYEGNGVGGANPAAAASSSLLSSEERLMIFESAGLLVGIMGDLRGDRLNTILVALISQLDASISKLEQAVSMMPQSIEVNALCEAVGHVIECLGNLCKGLPRVSDNEASQLLCTLPLVTRGLSRIPRVLDANVLFLLQRMVDCVGPRIFESVTPTVEHLLLNSDYKLLLDITIFLNQVVAKLKVQAFPLMDAVLVLWVRRCVDHSYGLWMSLPDDIRSDEQREALELHRHYYQLLHSMLAADLASIFTSPQNGQYFEQFFGTLVTGCGVRDPMVQKPSFASISKLALAFAPEQAPWGPPGALLHRVVPLLITVPMNPMYDLRDVASLNLLLEICCLQKTLSQRFGGEFHVIFAQELQTRLGLTPQMAAEYAKHSDTAAPKELKTTMLSLFIGHRR